MKWASLMAQWVKNLPAMQETQETTLVESLGQDDPLEAEKGNPLQYSFLENSMDRGAWRATYSPCGHRESHMTDQVPLSLSRTHTYLNLSTVHLNLTQWCNSSTLQ